VDGVGFLIQKEKEKVRSLVAASCLSENLTPISSFSVLLLAFGLEKGRRAADRKQSAKIEDRMKEESTQPRGPCVSFGCPCHRQDPYAADSLVSLQTNCCVLQSEVEGQC